MTKGKKIDFSMSALQQMAEEEGEEIPIVEAPATTVAENTVDIAIAENAAAKPSLSKPAKQKKSEPEEADTYQLNAGKIPESLRSKILSAAHKKEMGMRQFIFYALKEQGVAIPDRFLKDGRRKKNIFTLFL